MQEKTNIVLIAQFFFEGVPSSQKLSEMKELNPQDKEQLGEGIRNGSLTY